VALWGTPPAILLLGIVMIVVVERRRASAAPRMAPGNLTAAEEMRLTEILRGGAGGPG
jgi:cytochrome c-type biogenesis protein CcmH/NrfF